MTQAQIVNLLIDTLPYPEHMKNLEFMVIDGIRFSYHTVTYRVDANLSVDEVENGLLKRSAAAGFLSALLKLKHSQNEQSK